MSSSGSAETNHQLNQRNQVNQNPDSSRTRDSTPAPGDKPDEPTTPAEPKTGTTNNLICQKILQLAVQKVSLIHLLLEARAPAEPKPETPTTPAVPETPGLTTTDKLAKITLRRNRLKAKHSYLGNQNDKRQNWFTTRKTR